MDKWKKNGNVKKTSFKKSFKPHETTIFSWNISTALPHGSFNSLLK
jgi:hypothetical protein